MFITVLLVCAFLLIQSCSPGPQKLDKVGLQLWSVRGAMQEDFVGTLAKIADAGYDQVEFAGYYDREPAEIKSLLDSLGLEAPASHVGYNLLSGDNLQVTIDAAKIIGHKTLIMPSLPRLPRPPQPQAEEGQRRRRQRQPMTRDDVLKIAAIFNEVGQACAEAGLEFGFHNHQAEFALIDSTEIMFDILLQETNPDLVDFEMDLGWAIAAGADPLAYFEKYPGRFKYLHVKDMNAENESVVVGAGTIDFAAIFAASEKAGAEYFIVEYEGREDPIGSVAASVKYLKEMTY